MWQTVTINTKVESLKAKRCTFQSLNPMHPSKEKGQLPPKLLPNVYAYRKSFMSLGGTVLTIVPLTQIHFSKIIS